MEHSALNAALNGELRFDPDVSDHYSTEHNAKIRELYARLAAIVAAVRERTGDRDPC
jgi:hypothetical protein